MGSTADFKHDYYRARVSEATKLDYGTVGAVAANTVVAQIPDVGAGGQRGWYEIWGHGFADVADGLRLDVAGSTVVEFSGPANAVIYFGPIMREFSNDTDDITIETNAAITAKASATVYAKRMADA